MLSLHDYDSDFELQYVKRRTKIKGKSHQLISGDAALKSLDYYINLRILLLITKIK